MNAAIPSSRNKEITRNNERRHERDGNERQCKTKKMGTIPVDLQPLTLPLLHSLLK
jgi:hypothetical protein